MVFDDPRVSLTQEAFVAGTDTRLIGPSADIPNAEQGFALVFAASPFPGHQFRLEWRRSDGSGNWYWMTSSAQETNGWKGDIGPHAQGARATAAE